MNDFYRLVTLENGLWVSVDQDVIDLSDPDECRGVAVKLSLQDDGALYGISLNLDDDMAKEMRELGQLKLFDHPMSTFVCGVEYKNIQQEGLFKIIAEQLFKRSTQHPFSIN